MRTILIGFGITSILFSCLSHKGSDPAPASLHTEWYSTKQNTDDTARVQDGYLYLSTKYNGLNFSGTSVGTTQKIKGDFELRLTYSSFQTSGNTSISESVGFILNTSGVNRGVLSAMLSDNSMYLGDTSTATQTKLTMHRAGEFYVKRTGGDYISWFRADADTVYLNKTNYFTEDLTFTMGLSTNDNSVTHTSVHIDDFSLTGGGGNVLSDPFDVNHITPL